MPSSSSATFQLTLFDDVGVRDKVTVMTPVEAMFDDARNVVPDAYYDIVNVPFGSTVEITVRRVPAGETDQIKRERAFHKLWTACVGTSNYSKAGWQAVERQLRTADLIY